MSDPAGIHITRIYVNASRKTPSPVCSSTTVPVCTSTPIMDADSSNPVLQQQMSLIAKEILARKCSKTALVQKPDLPTPPSYEQYIFVSKETGQPIDFSIGDRSVKLNRRTSGTINKKKNQRPSSATVRSSSSSSGSSKSSDDGDYSIVQNNDVHVSNEKKKINFTSYDGIHVFTFTLDYD